MDKNVNLTVREQPALPTGGAGEIHPASERPVVEAPLARRSEQERDQVVDALGGFPPAPRLAELPPEHSTTAVALGSRIELAKANVAAAQGGLTPATFAPTIKGLAASRWSPDSVAAAVRRLEKAYPDRHNMTAEDAAELVRLRDMVREVTPWNIQGAHQKAEPLAKFFRSRGIAWSPTDTTAQTGNGSFHVDVKAFRATIDALPRDAQGRVVVDKRTGRRLANMLRDAVDDRQITKVKRKLITEGITFTGPGADVLQRVLDGKSSYRLDRLEIVDAARRLRIGGFAEKDVQHLLDVMGKHQGDLETMAFARRLTGRVIARYEKKAPEAAAAASRTLKGFFERVIPKGAFIKYDELNRLRREKSDDPWAYYAARAAVVTSSSHAEYQAAVDLIMTRMAASTTSAWAEQLREDSEQAAVEHREEQDRELDLERRESERQHVERRVAESRDASIDLAQRNEVVAFRGRQRTAMAELHQKTTPAGRDDAQAKLAAALAAELDADDPPAPIP